VAVDAPHAIIEHGLPVALRSQAAALFEGAFGDKMRLAIRDGQQRMAIMERLIIADHVVIARDEDRLLGMAGLSSLGPPFEGGLMGQSWDPRPLRDVLGWVGATWATLSLRLADHHPAADELYIDGLAVAPATRGQGIGSRLLAEIAATARHGGLRFVRLEVVDTNPRAQALYERLGYTVTRVESLRPVQRWTGFGAVISMELRVPPGPAADADGR
jgi:ribosomal protein S18 acetylase RimI-like enzyme